MLELTVLIISISVSFILGLFVFLKNPRSATNRLFLGLCLALVLWSVTNYFSVHPVLLPQLTWVRLVLFFAALLNLMVYLTFSVFPQVRYTESQTRRRLATGFTIIVMGLTLSPFVFAGLDSSSGSTQPVVAPGIGLFLAQTILLLSAAVWRIIRQLRVAKGRVRQQFKYVLFGIAASFSVIILTNFILAAFFRTTDFIPFGPSFTLLFTASIAYAIVRHRMLDIRAAVARSVAYVLLLVTLGGTYGLVIFTLSGLLIGSNADSHSQQLLDTVLAVVLAFTFQPLKHFYEVMTARIFFRDAYDSQELLSQLGQILVSEFKLEKILHKSLARLCGGLRVASGQMYIFDDNKIYEVEHYGMLPHKLITVPHLSSLHQNMVIADDLESGAQKTLMDEFGFRLIIRLRTKGEFVGYLMLGDKLGGDIYTKQDIELLEIYVQELSVAILNAKAYEEIADFNITLQQKVDDATRRLQAANRHLKELDEAKDEFISMASHQLRTPLTSIKGYLSMLIEGDAGKLTKLGAEFAGYAYDSSERMVSLIADLLNVSRVSAGKFIIETELCDLAVIVADEVHSLQSHAKAKNIELSFDQSPRALPLIEIDEGKTRQVIMNFIDNAIYYTQQGRVVVTLTEQADALELRVKDTGIGVPHSERIKLFHKFFRAENAQKVRPDGTGLGLFLAKRVVEDQGGSIIFESVESQGSTFGFRLPLPLDKKKVTHVPRQ